MRGPVLKVIVEVEGSISMGFGDGEGCARVWTEMVGWEAALYGGGESSGGGDALLCGALLCGCG